MFVNVLVFLFSVLLTCVLSVSGPVEADPEYRLIVAANNLTVEIDNELSELDFNCVTKANQEIVFILCSTEKVTCVSCVFRHHSQVYKGQILQEISRAGVFGSRFFRLYSHSQGLLKEMLKLPDANFCNFSFGR